MMDTNKMIFVFGSNLKGVHGAGAAKYARFKRGAELGIGQGPTGSCYALPTKGYRIQELRLSQIKIYVDQFINYAIRIQRKNFQVTQVGCGLGGHVAADIAPLFELAPPNCYFDHVWKPYLPETFEYWGTK